MFRSWKSGRDAGGTELISDYRSFHEITLSDATGSQDEAAADVRAHLDEVRRHLRGALNNSLCAMGRWIELLGKRAGRPLSALGERIPR